MFNSAPESMKKWSLFLRWWLIFMLVGAGSVMMVTTGVVDNINAVDFTKISFGIFALFIGFTIRNGIISHKMCKIGDKIKEEEVLDLSRKTEFGWFIADALLALGMIGTVLGFIFMLSTSFAGITIINTAALQGALTKMSMGMSTALYTTAVGLICGLILKVQLFDLSNQLDRLSRLCGCEDPNETNKA